MTIVEVARIAHEANRTYCQVLGEGGQVSWDDAPLWQRVSATNGVAFILEHPPSTPEDVHASWMAEKREEGWVYGREKDPQAKTHPNMVEFYALPAAQRLKDALFFNVVRALAPALKELVQT
jgi:hypothetical protein